MVRPAAHSRMLERGTLAVPLLFFLSGAAGLVYEVVWIRLLVGVFGATVLAVSTVLAAFMGGLALGSYLFGRLADRTTRPLMVFSALQIGIGLVSLVVPLLVRVAERAYPGLPDGFRDNFWLLSLARFGWCGLIILAPTTLMGGTLPVLSRWITGRGRSVGRGVGSLYAVNTFGAVLGTLGGGFYLIPTIGLTASLGTAAAANIGVGLIALLVARNTADGLPLGAPTQTLPADRASTERKKTTGEVTTARADEIPARMILALFAVIGFCSLSYEVLWTRVLVVFVPSTTFAFATMLSTFLVGIAVGSSVLSRFADRLRSPALALGLIESGIAVTALASLTSFSYLGSIAYPLTGTAASWARTLSVQFLLPAIIMVVPALLMGAAFPIVARMRVADPAAAGSGVGSIYAANTIGSILGSFVTGFVLIPVIGIQISIVMAACGNLAVAMVAFTRSLASQRRRAAWAGAAITAAAVAVAVAPFGRPVAISPGTEEFESADQKVVFYKEGITSSVTVTKSPDGDVSGFFVDRWLVVGTTYDAVKTVRLLGHLPIAAASQARDVAVIGYGMGMTTWTIALHDEVDSLDVVELSEGVVEGSRFFDNVNHNVLEDPRVSLHVDDGRNFLLMSRKQYDVISCDPIHPAGGSGALYTSDFFQLARDRLRPGGAMVQYLPFHKMSLFDFKMLIRTFQSVFPDATVWDGGGHGVLLGTVGPTVFDIDRLRQMVEANPALGEALAGLGLADPADLLSCLMLDPRSAAEFAGEGPINSDNRPLIEFSEPRSQGRDTRAENLMAITRYSAPPITLAGGEEQTIEELRPRLDRSTEVRRTLAGALLEISRRNAAGAADRIEAASRLDPDDPDVRSMVDRIAVPYWLDESARWLRARRYDNALSYAERALTVDPGNTDALAQSAAVHASQGRFGEAAALLERTVSAQPEDAAAASLLAQVYEDAGRVEDAV
ncbi:MAG: fused MFS/spermidine synthase, partial [Thermoleophilia bacterium]|nr:fused MFS/spermidine synthase [Thermoleophilia bacterium]